MKIRILLAIIAITLMPAFAAEKAPWKVGVATAVITPQRPMLMSGYAARKAPATGKDQDLFGKALAIEDQKATAWFLSRWISLESLRSCERRLNRACVKNTNCHLMPLL